MARRNRPSQKQRRARATGAGSCDGERTPSRPIGAGPRDDERTPSREPRIRPLSPGHRPNFVQGKNAGNGNGKK
eukprot:3650196-Amphidinium_carterae.1